MSAPEGLRLGVAACAAGAVVVLAAQAIGTRAFGLRPPVAPAAASARRGILYAFTAGMAPTAKESTRSHPVVYVLGVGYHLGAFTALGFLLWTLLAGAEAARLPLRPLAVALTAAGAGAGLALLVRRARSPRLRAISTPDDYLSNALATVFTGLAAAALLAPGAETAFLAAAMPLLCWMPLGKIRHCLFFFASRYNLGRHYGRRGTFPLRH